MPKQVVKSEKIQRLIARAVGDDDVAVDDLAVFEMRAFNTRPLDKRGSIFDGATHNAQFLDEMAALFEKGETVPLLAMHVSDLPLGRVFHAEPMRAADGEWDLNALFYLPKTATDLVASLDSGVINEVSVGVRHKHLMCSKCGWDYTGDDADFVNFFDRTCANGHLLGQEGTRLICTGLDKWMETSLVDRGAAQGTAILSRRKQILGADVSPERLAATGFHPGRVYLSASFGASNPSKHTPETKPVDELVELKASLLVANRDLDGLKAAATKHTETLTAKDAEIVELKQKLEAASALDGAKMKPDLDAANEFLAELATASLTALGRPATDLPKTVGELIETVRVARAQLVVSIPVGGVAAGSADDADKVTKPNFTAFKAR